MTLFDHTASSPVVRKAVTSLIHCVGLFSLTLLLFVQAASAQSIGLSGGNQKAWKPMNGLYLVLDQSIDIADLREAGREEIVLVNDYKFLAEKPEDPPVYMILRREPDVPLVLATRPVAGEDKDGKPLLNLSLAEEHVETLRRFTEENIGGTAAILINAEIVSAHTIKAAITGGKLQITRCDKNSCEYLLLELKKDATEK
jgi:hypothetical protein